MKYVLVLALGILTGLSFSRIPHYVNYYADHSLPKPYEGAKSFGNWSEEERATIDRYFNGGKG